MQTTNASHRGHIVFLITILALRLCIGAYADAQQELGDAWPLDVQIHHICFKDDNVKDVFLKLSQETGIIFGVALPDAIHNRGRQITLELRDVSLQEALNAVTAADGRTFRWSCENGIINITLATTVDEKDHYLNAVVQELKVDAPTREEVLDSMLMTGLRNWPFITVTCVMEVESAKYSLCMRGVTVRQILNCLASDPPATWIAEPPSLRFYDLVSPHPAYLRRGGSQEKETIYPNSYINYSIKQDSQVPSEIFESPEQNSDNLREEKVLIPILIGLLILSSCILLLRLGLMQRKRTRRANQ